MKMSPPKILRETGSAKEDAIFVSDDFDAPLPEDLTLIGQDEALKAYDVKILW